VPGNGATGTRRVCYARALLFRAVVPCRARASEVRVPFLDAVSTHKPPPEPTAGARTRTK
jgi:hypothetical protein